MATTTDIRTNPTAGGPTSRPMRKDAARNRELLIAAGREVFARRGLEASLDDIARQAGVGIGTAYRHFGNKFELAEAIMRTAISAVGAAAERALEHDDPWLGLVGFMEEVLEVQTKDRGLREVMMGVQTSSTSDEAYRLLREPILAILQRAQQSEVVRDDVSVTDLGCILTMLCEVSDLAGDTAPQLWRRYATTLMAGLRPGASALPGAPLTEEQFRVRYESHHALRGRHAGG